MIPELCVGAIVIDEASDSLLLVRRANAPGAGLWSFPGGRVEAGETLAGAVVRELFEETHVEGVCGQLVGWVERIDAGSHYVILDFQVTALDPIEPKAGSDASDAAWVPLPDVLDLPLVDGLAEFLSDHGLVDTIV